VVREKHTLEFLLPNTLNSTQVEGKVAWCRFHYKDECAKEPHFSAGIKFIDLGEPYRSLIRGYTLKLVCDEKLVRKQGIDRVLKEISNLPEEEKRNAVDILTQKDLIPSSR
jgi:hypothetical protein